MTAPLELPGGIVASFVILGECRTKKTSQRLIVTPSGKRKILPSKAHEKWANDAQLQVQSQWRGGRALTCMINMTARFFRATDDADLGNLIAGVCDVLEAAGVVRDDWSIRGLDGSRIYVDEKNPRVEAVLTRL